MIKRKSNQLETSYEEQNTKSLDRVFWYEFIAEEKDHNISSNESLITLIDTVSYERNSINHNPIEAVDLYIKGDEICEYDYNRHSGFDECLIVKYNEIKFSKENYSTLTEYLTLHEFKKNWLDVVSDKNKKISVNEVSNLSMYIMFIFSQKDFLSLENNINIINIKKIPRTAMVSILRYTRVAKYKINNWFLFRDRCIEELVERGENPNKILRDMYNDK